MKYFYNMRYPISTMLDYERKGWAIQASGGGLLIGRSHEEGGIYCWLKYEDDYVLEAEVEGYEYILNPGATFHYQKILSQFNRPDEHAYLPEPDYHPSGQIGVLDEMNKAVTYALVRPDYAQTVVVNRQTIIKRFFDQDEGFFNT